MALLTPRQAASELGISVRQLTELTCDGAIRWIDVGRGAKRPTRRFTKEDIDRFIEARAKISQPAQVEGSRVRPVTSIYRVIDFGATLENLRSERRRQKLAEKQHD